MAFANVVVDDVSVEIALGDASVVAFWTHVRFLSGVRPRVHLKE
jgi:hypothetical protein